MRRIIIAGSLLLASAEAWAGPGQASFTPSGYKYPIMKISIAMADYTNMQDLYTCPGTTAEECMIDLADATALAAIEAAAAEVAIREGSYTQIVLNNCPANTTGADHTKISVKGHVTVGGTTFNTSASADSGMDVGEEAFTDITWACGGARVTLHEPLVVAEGSTQALSLLVDLTYVLWTDAHSSSGLGGCKSDDGDGQDVCGSFPLVVPYVGEGSPTFERYLIAHLSTPGDFDAANANAAINFGIDPSGEVFFVGDQPFYSATSPGNGDPLMGGPDYFASVRTFSKNADASIALQAGGSIDDNRVGFSAFARSTHAGTCKNEKATSAVWSYKAFRQ